MTFIRTGALALCLFVSGLAGAAHAQSINADDKAAIGEIVREYLLENPEILFEMQQALEEKQAAETAEARSQILAASGDLIFQNPADPVLGNPDGDITVVEFFDYNCGFCRRAHLDMMGLIEADRDVRFVLKEFPILGPESQQAHIVSLAFARMMPDAYPVFMDRLIMAEGRADEAGAVALALELGADETELRAAMEDPAIRQQVAETYELASALNITGTPTYVIGDEVLSGAVGIGELRDKVANMRDCQSASC